MKRWDLRQTMRRFLAGVLAAALIMTPFITDGKVHAEGPADPAPIIHPAKPNGKKILFDNTHGQTAGAADWVIDGGFSDFAEALAGEGYVVKELRKHTPIELSDLIKYDVFIIGEANTPYKKSEQQAMLRYVQLGGSIFFIGDHYNADRNKNRWDASEVFNGYRRGAFDDPAKGMGAEEAASAAMRGVKSSDWLSDHFGVRFRYNAVGDVNATDIVSSDQAFGITKGVSSVAMHAGSTLAITDPSKAKGIVYLPKTNAKWPNAVDQGVYNGGGREEGPYAAISKVGLGKAGFIGDSSPVEDATPKYKREDTGAKKKTYDGFKEQDDALFLVNMVNWLAQKEYYPNLKFVRGLQLDQPTSLYEWEQPEKSVEPKPEPWAAPEHGYKWWDPATFKAGSYGINERPPAIDLYEPNNSMKTSYGPLVSGADYYGYINRLQDEDWFHFEVGKAGAVSVSLTQLPASYNLVVYDASGKEIGSAKQKGTADKIVSFEAPAKGTYYIQIKTGTNWYNPFKSYRLQVTYPKEVPPAPFAFIHQKILPNKEVFPIKVVVNGLAPNAVVQGYQVGIYLNGGNQVAKVQREDGTWPDTYGYSVHFQMEADARGHAEKTIMVQLNPEVSGEANLRLRQNGSNKLTETVTIGDVPVQPIP